MTIEIIMMVMIAGIALVMINLPAITLVGRKLIPIVLTIDGFQL